MKKQCKCKKENETQLIITFNEDGSFSSEMRVRKTKVNLITLLGVLEKTKINFINDFKND
jgi:hypothetical protein